MINIRNGRAEKRSRQGKRITRSRKANSHVLTKLLYLIRSNPPAGHGTVRKCGTETRSAETAVRQCIKPNSRCLSLVLVRSAMSQIISRWSTLCRQQTTNQVRWSMAAVAGVTHVRPLFPFAFEFNHSAWWILGTALVPCRLLSSINILLFFFINRSLNGLVLRQLKVEIVSNLWLAV